MNQGSYFFGVSFSNGDRAPIQYRRERQPNILKMIFPQEQTHPFSRQQDQWYWTCQTKAVFFQQWNQQATSCSSPQCPED